MRPNAKTAWFLAFTAIFAGLAGFVFWGTWSLDVVPVMPDARTTYAADSIWRELCAVFGSGKLIPTDVMRLVGSPYLWQELQYVVSLYFAALGLAFFCRGRGLSRMASYGAGLLLAFSGYWLTLFSAGHLGWFKWMTYGTFAFAFADRAVRRGARLDWLMLGALVSWAGFNQQDLWLLFTLLTGAYFVWCCVREHKLPWKGALLALAVFALIGLPNFAETLLVTVKGRQEQIDRKENITDSTADDREQRWEFVTNWSMPPEDTLEFIQARVQGDTSCPFVLSINRARGVRPYSGALGRPLNASRGNYRQHSLYVGWVTCLLALTGAVFLLRKDAPFRKGDALFFLIAAVGCYLLSLGRYLEPLYRLVFALPAGDLIRCPVKWHHLTEFSLVVLAAYGIDALWSKAGRCGWARVLVVALVTFGAVDLAREARLYCAPVSVRVAREKGLNADFAVLRRQDLANEQVSRMARAGLLRTVAHYLGQPDVYLMQVLKPFERSPLTLPKMPVSGWISILASLLVIVVAAKSAIWYIILKWK